MVTEGLRIKMLKTVRPGVAIEGEENNPPSIINLFAPLGTILKESVEYPARAGDAGAISGLCENGEWLGVAPGEFLFIKAPAWVLKKHGVHLDQRMIDWLRTGDRGMSSECIFEVLADHLLLEDDHRGRVPLDPDDWRSCQKLLEAIPEWKTELGKVADAYPAWRPFADHWGKLEALYQEDIKKEKRVAPRLYRRIQELNMGAGDE